MTSTAMIITPDEPVPTAVSTPVPTALPLAVPAQSFDVAVTGPFDADAALALKDEIAAACASGSVLVLLDVAGVTTVNPSGVAGLLDLMRFTRARGGDLRLWGDSPALQQAYTALQLESITRVYRTHREAADGDRSARGGRHSLTAAAAPSRGQVAGRRARAFRKAA